MGDTPASKRPNTDLEFSPMQDPTIAMSKKMLLEVLDEFCNNNLNKMLDEKLAKHLTPVRKDFEELSEKLEITCKEMDQLKIENAKVKDENLQLKKGLIRLEHNQRKNNLKFFGLKENKNEELEHLLLSILNENLDIKNKLNGRNIEKIHRLGLHRKGQNRPVLVKFTSFKDKLAVLAIREPIRLIHNISFSDDLPQAVEQNRREIFPVFQALRRIQKVEGKDVSMLKLKEDKLFVNGSTYTVDNLKDLPGTLSLHDLFTPSRNNITAFFRKYSKFSNHNKVEFEFNGNKYTSMEKYLFIQKAEIFEDAEVIYRLNQTDDPVQIKHIGRQIKDFNQGIWEDKVDAVLSDGLLAKFSQNPEYAKALLTTESTTIVEASRDSNYGVGLTLENEKLWDSKHHKGKNWLGKALMTTRETMKTMVSEGVHFY